jgi:translation initiation factor 2A
VDQAKDALEKEKKHIAATLTPQEKELRNLQKKLKEIEELKARQRQGGKLEANQLAKIEREAQINREINALSKLAQNLSL